MKILGIVPVFNPDINLLINSVKSYLPYIDHLILWDNSPIQLNNKNKLIEDFIKISSKVSYLSKGDNIFLAKAFNEGLKWGKERAFTHLLTMDQDSVFVEDSCKKYIEEIKCLSDKEPYLNASFSPRIKDANVPSKMEDDSLSSLKEVNKTISSGSIYPIDILLKLGGFREDYYIDYVDFELCCRLKTNKLKIFQSQKGLLLQQYGKTEKHSFFYTLNYSPIRLYYQTRNRIIIKKEYPTMAWVGSSLAINLKLIMKILISESQKLKKIRAIIKGWKDGKGFETSNKEMGK